MQLIQQKFLGVISTAVAAVSLLALVPATRAAVVAYDGFDYGATQAQLDGASFDGGTGWSGSWIGRGGAGWGATYVPTDNLSIPGQTSVGGGITRTGETSASIRNLPTALSSGTYYVAMNIQVDSFGWDPKVVGGRFIPQGVYDSEFCMFGLRNNGGGASYFIGNTTGTNVMAFGAGTLQTIVLKMNLDTNTASLYSVTDASGYTPGSESTYYTGVSNSFSRKNYYNPSDPTQYPLKAVEVDIWNGANGILDEYRIATTFAEALGLPKDPSTGSTWNVDAGGTWSTAGNWSAEVPTGTDAIAILGDIITSAQIVTLDTDVTLGKLSINNGNSYAIDGANNLIFSSTGTAELNVVSGNHMVNPAKVEFQSNTNLNLTGSVTLGGTVNGVVVDSGKTVNVNNGGNLTIQGTLHLNGSGAQVAFAPKTAGVVGAILFVDSTSSIAGTGSIDISSNNVVVHSSTDTDVISNLLNTGKLTSSMVAGNPGIYALGVLNGSDYKVGNQGNLSAYIVQDSDAVVRFTYAGDVNLDGEITTFDFAQIDAAYLSGLYTSSGALWINGDSDHNGKIDFNDFVLIDAAFAAYWNYGNPVALARAEADAARFGEAFTTAYNAALASVPEPASLSLLVLAAGGLLGRRRR